MSPLDSRNSFLPIDIEVSGASARQFQLFAMKEICLRCANQHTHSGNPYLVVSQAGHEQRQKKKAMWSEPLWRESTKTKGRHTDLQSSEKPQVAQCLCHCTLDIFGRPTARAHVWTNLSIKWTSSLVKTTINVNNQIHYCNHPRWIWMAQGNIPEGLQLIWLSPEREVLHYFSHKQTWSPLRCLTATIEGRIDEPSEDPRIILYSCVESFSRGFARVFYGFQLTTQYCQKSKETTWSCIAEKRQRRNRSRYSTKQQLHNT